MDKRKIILIGGGGHAKACIDVISTNPKLNILGYLDRIKTLNDSYEIDYLGPDADAYQYIGKAEFLITIGHLGDSSIRKKIYQDLKSKNAKFATVFAANAIFSKKSTVGEGTIIMHSVILQAETQIGNNCIINDRVLIEHDSFIGNQCHISTGAIINGCVNIGNDVFIGSGSIIRNGISIGDNCKIGMGAVVTKNVNNGETVFGNPAKIKL